MFDCLLVCLRAVNLFACVLAILPDRLFAYFWLVDLIDCLIASLLVCWLGRLIVCSCVCWFVCVARVFVCLFAGCIVRTVVGLLVLFAFGV